VRIGELCEQGWIVALDEFQYFHHKPLYPFTSELQSEVDRLAATPQASGGLIVLGSLHTEMQALLEDRSAPLYQRLTDNISLGHLDIASLLELLMPMRTRAQSGCCFSGICSRGCRSSTETALNRV
jgi:hypothetical protein